jgi:predicted AlkP superfamily pyrophosphatase or phosphodiesterase
MPGEHGFFGYRIFDRDTRESVNLLTGLSVETVKKYLMVRISSEIETRTVVVSRPEYRDSAFSQATFGSARFIGEVDIENRFSKALDELNSSVNQVVYLYIPELDQAAHKFGYQSAQWIERLELVDAQVQKLVQGLGSNRGVVLTADHGIVDVPQEKQIYLDECEGLHGLVDVGGDPRASFLYFEGGSTSQSNRQILENFLAGVATVHSITELVEHGFYSSELMVNSHLLPDLVVLPKPGRACYHRAFAKQASLQMIGQHGGITDQEMSVPIIRLGAYSSSLLVP